VLEFKGDYLIHHLSQENMQWRAGIECHARETTDRPKSPEIKQPEKKSNHKKNNE